MPIQLLWFKVCFASLKSHQSSFLCFKRLIISVLFIPTTISNKYNKCNALMKLGAGLKGCFLSGSLRMKSMQEKIYIVQRINTTLPNS